MTTTREASVTIAREVVQQWTGIVRFHTADTNYIRLVDLIAAALDQQIEKDAKVADQQAKPAHTYASENADTYRAVEASAKYIAAAIRQQGTR